MRVKIRKKSEHWKHGKHKGQVEFCVQTNRELTRREKLREVRKDMAASVRELFRKK